MINNLELRIGNYILVDNVTRKICCIKNDDCLLQSPCIGFEQNNDCEYEISGSERVQALPITDQLLRDLGFIFHDHLKVWQHTKYTKPYAIELDADYSALDFSGRPFIKNMQYLHQLQNLYYCIQGEELVFLKGNMGPGSNYQHTQVRESFA